MYSWRGRRRGDGQRSRAKGCLLLVLLVIVVLIILSLMFGGFQKGTKSGSHGSLAPVAGRAVPGNARLSLPSLSWRAGTDAMWHWFPAAPRRG